MSDEQCAFGVGAIAGGFAALLLVTFFVPPPAETYRWKAKYQTAICKSRGAALNPDKTFCMDPVTKVLSEIE